MSTSTTHRSSTRAHVGVGAAPDEPQFHVRFTPENDPAPEAPNNSFRWSGWATLHIGPRGVLVAARRRAWMGFHRRDRRFFPSAAIRRVYREGSAVRVELDDGPAGKQSFQFWPGDLRAAATIVALLPTASTVEIDSPPPPETPAPARRASASIWVVGLSTLAVAGLIAGSVALLRQSERSLQSAGSTSAIPTAASTVSLPLGADKTKQLSSPPDPEALNGVLEYERFEPQIQGLKRQFLTALTALEVGTVSQAAFSDGLENWLIPQWRVLSSELTEVTPLRDSVRYTLHQSLDTVTVAWQAALQSYATGLREHDAERDLAAFAQMKRATELEWQAERGYATLQRQALQEGAAASP